MVTTTFFRASKRRLDVMGFSLIELLIVVAIVGIAMGIAVPSMRDLLANQRTKSVALDMLTTVMLAKGEAIKRGTEISIKAPSDDLNQGWCVIFGTAADCDTAAPGTGVMFVQAANRNLDIDWVAPSTGTRITFNRAGRLATLGQVRFRVSDPTGAGVTRCVTINVSGGVTHAPSASGAC